MDYRTSTKAMELLRGIDAPAKAEWSRFARERHLSVEEGHAFVAESVALELESLAAAHEAFYGASFSEPEVTALLNRAPERSVAPLGQGERAIQILSWGISPRFINATSATACCTPTDSSATNFRRKRRRRPSIAKSHPSFQI